MKRNDSGGLAAAEGESRVRRWVERLRTWLGLSPRRTRDRSQPEGSRTTLLSGAPLAEEHAPLSDSELDGLKRAYLYRLERRYSTLRLYGLDARRRAAQVSGRALALAAIYTPLNATLGVTVEADAPGGTVPTSSAPRARPMSAVEAVGRERNAVVRGPHGSGKSTFFRFLALSLAERSPDGKRTGMARLEPAWTHGWLFPLLIDLFDFAASPYDDGTAEGLCAYIAAELGIYPDQLWKQVISPGGVLFLLDGLERAPDATAGFVARLARSVPESRTPNHFFVASQQYVDLVGLFGSRLGDFAQITLASWTAEQMDVYVRQWYAELERQGWIEGDAAGDLAAQLRSSLRRDEVKELAQHPSWMAIIALLHTLRGRLPANRVVFYHDMVELGLTVWSEGDAGDERDLRQDLNVDGLRAAVAQATYQGYTRLDGPTGLVELPASELRASLVSVCRDGRWEAVGHLMTHILTRPGLLGECGPDVYAFTAPSLQVHVAARHLAAQPDLPRLVVQLAQEDFDRWREVIYSAVARLARLGDELPAAIATIDALCQRRLLDEREGQIAAHEWRMAWLAGEALLGVVDEFEISDVSRTLGRVKGWLVALLERGMLEPAERAQAGSVLDRLPGGDPRPGVSLPDPVWCEVAAGSFWQGEGESARILELDAYWIARYPVTNAQYAAFVEATGHSPPPHWQGGRPRAGTGNHPMVYVTWQDATEYCRWWARHLRDSRAQVWRLGRLDFTSQFSRSWTVRLPTGVEWEKAARGGLLIPAPGNGELVDNPLPRRAYPWGDSWRLSAGGSKGDETRCNVSESDVGTTTPTGMYPDGASPYGLVDLAGNVWEWCLDWADEEGRYKIRRGGAFRYTHEHARCAAYDKAHPGLAWPYLGFRMVLGPSIVGSSMG